jgi:chemotaxis protein methyltransferase CheR
MSDIHNLESLYKAELKPKDFDRLSKFIMKEYGIKMPPEKKIMLQSRLQKRLKALNIDNFKDYVEYVFTPIGLRFAQ